MKKACIVFPYPMGDSFLSGGVSKLIVANVEAIKDEYEIDLIAPQDNASLLNFMNAKYPTVRVHLVNFYPLARFVDNRNVFLRGMGIIKRIFQFLRTKKRVKKAIKEIDPDILHLHGEVTFPYLKYGATVGAGTIFHTSCFRFSKPKFLGKMVVKNSLKHADLIVSPTRSISGLFGEHDKNVVVPNPIIAVDGREKSSSCEIEKELTDFSGLKILFVGRICVVKQIHYIIQAIAGIPTEQREGVRFYVIGKPNFPPDYVYFDKLKALVEEHGLENNVFFLGYKPNVDEYMKKADVGVLVSESEAISMAGIEYLHNALPIIGFNNPGIDETVVDGVDGFLVADGDVQGLTNSIVKFFDGETLSAMKKNAFEECEKNFSMNAFKNRITSYYNKIAR